MGLNYTEPSFFIWVYVAPFAAPQLGHGQVPYFALSWHSEQNIV